MNFVLMVEGQTEDKALRQFLQRWLDQELTLKVGIKIVRFDGWSDLVKNAATKARWHINESPGKDNIITVIALLDLYGPTFYPSDKSTAIERYDWAKNYMELQVNHPKFHQHFAIHETEAWLLSEPSVFPPEIRKALEGKYPPPEKINFDRPPAKLLNELYSARLKRSYRKVVDGKALFAKLTPSIAYQKCPSLKILLDEMLELAKGAGH
ncbi:MAG: DUF4276 family protein [Janthinobacterium lividum]